MSTVQKPRPVRMKVTLQFANDEQKATYLKILQLELGAFKARMEGANSQNEVTISEITS